MQRRSRVIAVQLKPTYDLRSINMCPIFTNIPEQWLELLNGCAMSLQYNYICIPNWMHPCSLFFYFFSEAMIFMNRLLGGHLSVILEGSTYMYSVPSYSKWVRYTYRPF